MQRPLSGIPVAFVCSDLAAVRRLSYASSDRFGPLVQDVWAGEYSTLKPSTFKSSLELNHPQFKGSIQHDCQEFLALLLGSLHEELKARNRGSGHRGKYNKANSSSYGGRASTCTLNTRCDSFQCVPCSKIKTSSGTDFPLKIFERSLFF